MRHVWMTLAILVVATLSPAAQTATTRTTTPATTSTTLSANAADIYRRAFDAVPLSPDLTPAQRRAIIFPESAPLDEAVQALLDDAAEAFALFEQASAMTHCDWGFRADEPRDAVQIVRRAGDLVELLELRTRFRAEAGAVDEALADCFRMAVLGRRIDQPPLSGARALQATVYINNAISTAAIIGMDVPPEKLAEWARSVHALPPPSADSARIAAEKAPFLWHVRGVFDHPEVLKYSSNLMGLVDEQVDHSALEDLVAHPEKREPALEEAAVVFDEMVRITRLDAGVERDAEWKALEARMRTMHPLAQRAFAIGKGTLHLSGVHRTIMDAFETGVRIRAAQARGTGDDEALSAIAQPFEYVKRPRGFELREPEKKPGRVLIFGPHDPPPPVEVEQE